MWDVLTRAAVSFSLLNTLLLSVMAVFLLARRPRQPTTWGFAGVMVGLALYYLGDLMQWWPDQPLMVNLAWQYATNAGAYMAILASVALVLLFRKGCLAPWEWAVVVFIVARAILVDFIWLATWLRPDRPRACAPSPAGYLRIVCPQDAELAIATGALTAVLLAVLFVRTALVAPEAQRPILRRYVVWIALLIAGGSVINHVATARFAEPTGQLISRPIVLAAVLLGMRMMLALEEQETGIRLSGVGRAMLLWLTAMVVALGVDLSRGWPGVPLVTLAVLGVGVAAAGAYLLNEMSRRAASATARVEREALALRTASLPAPAETTGPPSTPGALRIYLLGPMRVERDGKLLSNSTQVWRSAKTRSLLAFLALAGRRGATQAEIVDALWPIGDELDGAAEQRSLAALRSYLSTLRRVLEPDGPRGSQRYIQQEGSRYFLGPSAEVWVDVWEFERLSAQARALWAQGDRQAAAACWEEALALYPPEGLLLTEEHLDSRALEAARERLRQTWLLGLRCLIGFYTEAGEPLHADELRRTLQAAENQYLEE